MIMLYCDDDAPVCAVVGASLGQVVYFFLKEHFFGYEDGKKSRTFIFVYHCLFGYDNGGVFYALFDRKGGRGR